MLRTAIALSILLTAGSAQAGISLATAPADFSANATIDWAQLGATQTAVDPPVTVSDSLGNTAVLNSPGGITRLNERDGWFGNFTIGDALIYKSGLGTDITLTFANPIKAAGANIEPETSGSFLARITAYDVNGTALGVVTRAGTSDSTAGTAIFIGVISMSSNIGSIAFSVDTGGTPANKFAINNVQLGTPAPVQTPAPAGVALLVLGTAMLGAARRR